MNRHVLWLGAMTAAVLACAPSGDAQQAPDAQTLAQYRQQREEAAYRTRRLIFNNDGDDHLLSGEVSIEAFLAKRTTPLLGSQVDSIFYCTSRPMGVFLHDTEVGDVLTMPHPFGPDRYNIVGDLLEQGTDPLEVMVDFCHQHGLECFWSMRMNDVHDAYHPADGPEPYFSTFKREHPEFLFGTRADRPAYGAWSAVDYAEPEVRDFVFRVFREICRNYDVEGAQLDFFRHLVYFRTVAEGEVATDQEREMMTELVRRIRAMTEEEGMRRGRPILVAIRTPDSVGYCRDMGLDIERWMEEGLIDLFVAAGDFRLNPWEYSIRLGERNDIPVYCDLDPAIRSGVSGDFDRNSLEGYRGRAMNAWSAGAAGLHLFNCFNPHRRLWWELGDPDKLRRMDKLYFVNVTGRSGYLRAGQLVPGGEQYDNLPSLHPQDPLRLPAEGAVEVPLRVGEDVAGAAEEGLEATVTCHAFASVASPLQVSFNGTALAGSTTERNWFSYPVRPELVRQGVNRVELSMSRTAEQPGEWSVEYQCDEQPPTPWSARPRSGTEATMQDGALLIADRSTEQGSYLYYSYPWNISPEGSAVVEAEAKVVSGRNTIIVANGVAEEEIRLFPDRVTATHADQSHAMDTTDAFHLYRVELEGSDIRVLVDGELVIDAPAAFTHPAAGDRNTISIGAGSSGETGAALWRVVRFRPVPASVFDLVLEVDYPEPADQ
ncbi:MAG: hypothetical protein ACP5KN_13610 [Armatimonadota bacterium]